MSGVRRYKDFRGRLGIANSVLTVRLRRLTEAGVFTCLSTPTHRAGTSTF